MAEENAESQPIGAASIGSNDIHLLVAATDGVVWFDRLLDRSTQVGLSGTEEDKGAHAALPTAALADALQVMDDLIARARSAGARRIIAVGTEVLREASNGAAFCALLAATFGIEAVIIGGEEEAALDYAWATFPAPPESPLLVVDSGGGSTQVIVSAASRPFAVSLPIGAENLTRRFIAHDPPKARELKALTAHVSGLIGELPLPDASIPKPAAILMGGSADHLAALSAHPKRRRLSCDDLDAAIALFRRTSANRVAQDYNLPPERSRLLAAGAIILREVLAHYHVDAAQVKADGIRGGLIVRCARHGDDWRAGLALHAAPGARAAGVASAAPRGKRRRPATG